MRSRTSDNKLILGTLLLLVVEVVWLLAHLQVIPNSYFSGGPQFESRPAGYVVKSQRELRRRQQNSLIWEQSSINDTLYYYDSVLTLSQSSATLYLQEQTEIHLSENTLVTIEPQDDKFTGQIRLKFSKGDLRARNPYAQTKIETPEWSIDLNQGSEVALKQTGKDNFEVEVLKGDLKFEQEDKVQTLSENQVLKIEDNTPLETLSIEKDLKLAGPEYQRIYSFNETVKVPLTWDGEAQKIQITPLGSDTIAKEISRDQKTETLDLAPGKYSVRLVNNGKVSTTKEIEIWKAPVVHLLSPFPRDRVKTKDDISFVWSIVPEAKEYRFEITDHRTGQKTIEKSYENFVNYTLKDEGHLSWRVIAIDADGFEIPSLYANPIYSKIELLAAPKLKTPEFRKPAREEKPKKSPKKKDGAFHKFELWFELFAGAKAEAQSKKSAVASYEAVFAWEKVDGADGYTIEISKTPDFRSPVLTKKVKATQFIWSKFPLGTYYWRVAGETRHGDLGEFSEPAKINLEKIPDKEFNNLEGVIVRPTYYDEKHRADVSTKDDDIIANAPKPSFDETVFNKKIEITSQQQRELKDTYLFAYTPSYYSWVLNGDDQLKAKFNDTQNNAGRFRTEQTVSDSRSFVVDVYYAQTKWAADSVQFPYQDEVTIVDSRVQVLLGSNKYDVSTGAALQSVPIVERKDNEAVEVKTVLVIGPSVQYYWRDSDSRWSGDHQLSFLAGSSAFMFSTQNMVKFDLLKGESSSLFGGFRLQADAIFNRSHFSSGYSFGVVLGFENF